MRILKLALIFITSISNVCATRDNNNDIFYQIFKELNKLANQQKQQQQNLQKQNFRKKVQMSFFNNPFFNDPFFSNPFDDPFFRQDLNNSQDDENYSYYIIISSDPQQTTTIRPNTQQRPSPKPQTLPQRPQIQQRPSARPTSNLNDIFPLLGRTDHNFGHNGCQNQYSQYDPENSKNKVKFKDVLGQQEAITDVVDIVDFLKNPAKYHKLGAEIPKGVLFEGPPGTGKTMLARAIANEAGCTFIHASGSQFINKYVGTGADNIRKLFEQARKQAPAIIFIDEIDAVGSRERDENQEYKHTINALLNEMDGFRQEENVIVFAATNYKKSLDKALLRPGRFDRIVKLNLPNKSGRKDLLNYYISTKQFDSSIEIDKLAQDFAQRTPGFSGADIKKLANEAALLACRQDANFITKKHLETAYDKVILGPKNNLDRTQEQLRRTAYHEAGHLVIKLLTDQPVAKVSILSRGDTLGIVWGKEKYETDSEYRKEELVEKIVGLYGGFVAEKHFLNCTRPGASHDLKQVREIAKFMIRECGMGDGDLEGVAYNKEQFRELPDDMKNKIISQELKLMNDCKQKAEKLLEDKKELVHEIAAQLLDKETLTEKEILQISGR